MANYHSIKNAAILTPTTNTDLGSDANRYSNVYMSGNIVMSNGVTVTSTNAVAPRVTSIAYPGNDTAADPAGGQTITLNGSGFVTGANVLISGSVTSSISVVNSSTITFISPALSAGSYVIYVINADGSTAISIPGIQYSGVPAWTTSAGSLGSPSKNTSVSYTVAATGDAPITYSVVSGSLPTGLSLNSTSGVISGTTPNVGSATTYNFTIRASDAQNQDTDRAFSLNVTVATPPSTVEYLVVAGGGAGGSNAKGWNTQGGGGAGGFRTSVPGATSGRNSSAEALYSIQTGTPITVTVGAGGVNGTNGGDSQFGTVVSLGGGAGAIPANGSAWSPGSPANDGGSGGGGGGDATSTYVPTTAGAGTAGQGYGGGTKINGAGGPAWGGSGGGGAGAVGGDNSSNSSGNGGAGLTSSITGTSTSYAGGGGAAAGSNTSSSSGGYGGAGGGGTGARFDRSATGGDTNSGGGGGGGQQGGGTPSISGSGGSGIVIIRYADTYLPAVSTTGSPTYTTPTGYRVYKFTSSGSITF